MNDFFLKDLLDRYLTGNINAGEKKHLLQLMDQHGGVEILEGLLEESFKTGVFTGDEDPAIKLAIHDWLQKNMSKEKKQNVFRMRPMIAAASVIMVLAAI